MPGWGQVSVSVAVTLKPAGARAPRIVRVFSLTDRMISTTSALLFIAGCLAFYVESLYNLGVTLFLAGSLLMLVSALRAETSRAAPTGTRTPDA